MGAKGLGHPNVRAKPQTGRATPFGPATSRNITGQTPPPSLAAPSLQAHRSCLHRIYYGAPELLSDAIPGTRAGDPAAAGPRRVRSTPSAPTNLLYPPLDRLEPQINLRIAHT